MQVLISSGLVANNPEVQDANGRAGWGSNPRASDSESAALPTELPAHKTVSGCASGVGRHKHTNAAHRFDHHLGGVLRGSGRPFDEHILRSMSKTQPVNIVQDPQNKDANFLATLRKILRVSHAEMQERSAQQRESKKSLSPAPHKHDAKF
jgi:hypothetical protein